MGTQGSCRDGGSCPRGSCASSRQRPAIPGTLRRRAGSPSPMGIIGHQTMLSSPICSTTCSGHVPPPHDEALPQEVRLGGIVRSAHPTQPDARSRDQCDRARTAPTRCTFEQATRRRGKVSRTPPMIKLRLVYIIAIGMGATCIMSRFVPNWSPGCRMTVPFLMEAHGDIQFWSHTTGSK